MVGWQAAVVATTWAVALAGEPSDFRDNDDRFAVALPAGWRFNPAVTDLSGALFLGQRDGRVAQAVVKVFTFPQAMSLERFAAAMLAASDQEPDFHLRQKNTPLTLARHEGLGRSFTLRGPPGQHQLRVIDQQLVVVGHLGYLVQCETLAGSYEAFRGDFAHIFAGLRLRDDLLAVPRKKARAPHLAAADLVGHWQGGGHRMALSPSGHADLDGREGTWRLNLGVLEFSFEAQDSETVFEVEGRAGSLMLRGGSFGDGQAFTRVAPHHL